jgi:curved DNA-binding protein CbpA
MMERAFTGFAQLPSADWRSILGVGLNVCLKEAEAAFGRLAIENHPDRGGDSASMAELSRAREDARRELG